jgi:hypothetical protein
MEDSHLQGRTGFLSLPAELRNRIYNLSLIRGTFCMYNCRGRPWSTVLGIYGPSEIPLGLLQVNHQTRAEAAPILYGANRFIFPDNDQCWEDLESWLEQIGARNCKTIRESMIFPPNVNSLELQRHTVTRCEKLLGATIDLTLPLVMPYLTVDGADGREYQYLGIVWKNGEQILVKTSKGGPWQKMLRDRL